jgi:undecaprenyl-diphosphatase
MAFLSALIVVKPFLRFVVRAGFAPFAWYRIAAGLVILGLMGGGFL